ncbi:MAG: peptidylprolyl isomerase [Pseudomonadota bacterium]
MRLPALLREPLTHFLIIGAGVFAVYDAISPEDRTADPGEIVVAEPEITRMIVGFESVWRRPPTTQELAKLTEDFIREEILVREAIALGLDRGDTVVRRRLRQKMAFLLASAAHGQVPDDAVLQAHFLENQQKYAASPSVTFTHVFLGEAPDGADVAEVLGQLRAGADHRALGQRILVPQRIDGAPKQAVDGMFGAGFFDQLVELETADWGGPIRSGYGEHLVRIEPLDAPPDPVFAELRDRVLEDWRRDRSETMLDDAYRVLREGYVVVDGSAE